MRNSQQRVRGGGVLSKHQIDHFDEWDMEQNRAFSVPSWDPIHAVIEKRQKVGQSSGGVKVFSKLFDVFFRG